MKEKEIKDRMLHDAIQVALEQRKVIVAQRFVLTVFIGCIAFVLRNRKGV